MINRQLRDLLAKCCPHWSAKNHVQAANKLLRLGIRDCVHLACYLGETGKSVRINRELAQINEKGFSKGTVARLKKELEDLGIGQWSGRPEYELKVRSPSARANKPGRTTTSTRPANIRSVAKFNADGSPVRGGALGLGASPSSLPDLLQPGMIDFSYLPAAEQAELYKPSYLSKNVVKRKNPKDDLAASSTSGDHTGADNFAMAGGAVLDPRATVTTAGGSSMPLLGDAASIMSMLDPQHGGGSGSSRRDQSPGPHARRKRFVEQLPKYPSIEFIEENDLPDAACVVRKVRTGMEALDRLLARARDPERAAERAFQQSHKVDKQMGAAQNIRMNSSTCRGPASAPPRRNHNEDPLGGGTATGSVADEAADGVYAGLFTDSDKIFPGMVNTRTTTTLRASQDLSSLAHDQQHLHHAAASATFPSPTRGTTGGRDEEATAHSTTLPVPPDEQSLQLYNARGQLLVDDGNGDDGAHPHEKVMNKSIDEGVGAKKNASNYKPGPSAIRKINQSNSTAGTLRPHLQIQTRTRMAAGVRVVVSPKGENPGEMRTRAEGDEDSGDDYSEDFDEPTPREVSESVTRRAAGGSPSGRSTSGSPRSGRPGSSRPLKEYKMYTNRSPTGLPPQARHCTTSTSVSRHQQMASAISPPKLASQQTMPPAKIAKTGSGVLSSGIMAKTGPNKSSPSLVNDLSEGSHQNACAIDDSTSMDTRFVEDYDVVMGTNGGTEMNVSPAEPAAVKIKLQHLNKSASTTSSCQHQHLQHKAPLGTSGPQHHTTRDQQFSQSATLRSVYHVHNAASNNSYSRIPSRYLLPPTSSTSATNNNGPGSTSAKQEKESSQDASCTTGYINSARGAQTESGVDGRNNMLQQQLQQQASSGEASNYPLNASSSMKRPELKTAIVAGDHVLGDRAGNLIKEGGSSESTTSKKHDHPNQQHAELNQEPQRSNVKSHQRQGKEPADGDVMDDVGVSSGTRKGVEKCSATEGNHGRGRNMGHSEVMHMMNSTTSSATTSAAGSCSASLYEGPPGRHLTEEARHVLADQAAKQKRQRHWMKQYL